MSKKKKWNNYISMKYEIRDLIDRIFSSLREDNYFYEKLPCFLKERDFGCKISEMINILTEALKQLDNALQAVDAYFDIQNRLVHYFLREPCNQSECEFISATHYFKIKGL